jgi:hypothetical protein
VERGLHRRGWDPVWVDDPRLDREDDRDGARDRDDPVERDPPAVGQVREEAVDRVAGVLPLRGGPVARGVVPGALVRVGEDVVRIPQLAPEAVLPAALERDAAVGCLDFLR